MDSVNAGSAVSPSKAKSSSLRQRVLTAVVLLPPVVGVIYWGTWPLVVLIAVSVAVCLLELYGALKHSGYQPRAAVGLSTALLLCAAAALQGSTSFDITGAALALGLLFAIITEMPRRQHQRGLENWALTFASACYIGWLMSHYILLRRLETPLEPGWLSFLQLAPGAAWVYLVLMITWLQDTMAFFVGRSFGRHRMSRYISPQKSWEGAAGGILSAMLGAMLAVPALGLPIGYPAAALLGTMGGSAGLLGDLAESWIKRQIGIKDISNLMPGHGGIFDRADSMLFTAPILYYLIRLLTASVQ